jgi:P4 family phage/plasmid primase-like protien
LDQLTVVKEQFEIAVEPHKSLVTAARVIANGGAVRLEGRPETVTTLQDLFEAMDDPTQVVLWTRARGSGPIPQIRESETAAADSEKHDIEVEAEHESPAATDTEDSAVIEAPEVDEPKDPHSEPEEAPADSGTSPSEPEHVFVPSMGCYLSREEFEDRAKEIVALKTKGLTEAEIEELERLGFETDWHGLYDSFPNNPELERYLINLQWVLAGRCPPLSHRREPVGVPGEKLLRADGSTVTVDESGRVNEVDGLRSVDEGEVLFRGEERLLVQEDRTVGLLFDPEPDREDCVELAEDLILDHSGENTVLAISLPPTDEQWEAILRGDNVLGQSLEHFSEYERTTVRAAIPETIAKWEKIIAFNEVTRETTAEWRRISELASEDPSLEEEVDKLIHELASDREIDPDSTDYWEEERAEAREIRHAVEKLIAEIGTPISDAELGESTDQWAKRRVLASGIAKQIRYVADTGRWHVWNGHAWADDRTQRAKYIVEQGLLRASKFLLDRAALAPSDRERKPLKRAAARLQEKAAVDRILALLEYQPQIAVASSDLDADDWHLNTPGGIVDLQTGNIEPADPSALCSKATAVAPAPGKLEKWLGYLNETTQGDHDLQRFLQKQMGYALTGSTDEQTLTFIWGGGATGKSLFIETMQRIFGGYAQTAAMDTFAASRNDRHPADLAKLFGARLVTASETQEGRQWDSQRVKAITGGDTISARFMRQDFFDYAPKFKLVIVGNHEPRIGNVDDAMRRRIHIVPFTNPVPEEKRNRHLVDELVNEEAAQILKWLIDGCLLWQQEGLRPPEVVLARTEEYFEEEDDMGRFLEEYCEFDPKSETSTRKLFYYWRVFANSQAIPVGTQTDFTRRLKKRNDKRLSDCRVWEGDRRLRGIRGLRVRPEAVGEEGFQLTRG